MDLGDPWDVRRGPWGQSGRFVGFSEGCPGVPLESLEVSLDTLVPGVPGRFVGVYVCSLGRPWGAPWGSPKRFVRYPWGPVNVLKVNHGSANSLSYGGSGHPQALG